MCTYNLNRHRVHTAYKASQKSVMFHIDEAMKTFTFSVLEIPNYTSVWHRYIVSKNSHCLYLFASMSPNIPS